MFDLMIFILQASFLVSITVGPLTLLGLRIYYAFKKETHFKEKLFIILIPCSLGFYLKAKEPSKFKYVYQELTIAFIVLLVIGSLLLIYLQLGVYYAF